MPEVRYRYTREAAERAASGHFWPCRAPVAETQTSGVWPLFIGLQIALFACFLALVGLSCDGTGAAKPVDPVAANADDDAPASAGSPGTVAAAPAAAPFAPPRATTGGVSEGVARTATAAALNGLLRLLAPEQPPSPDALRIEIPAELLFVANSASLQPAGRAAARQMAAALAEPMDDVPLAASLLLVAAVPTGAGIADEPADSTGERTVDRAAAADADADADADSALARRRGLSFLRAVLAEGAPAGSFAVGVGDGTPGSAVLSWQLRAVDPAPQPEAAREATASNGRIRG